MSMRAADTARSRIVLVGSPAYEDPALADVPEVARNLADLHAVLTDPRLGGFPVEHCVTAPPDATVAAVGDLLEDAADKAEDLLLFYFAGHGIVGPEGELYLALRGTRSRSPAYSALPFDTIRDTFRSLRTKAANRAVIIDSCFSGRAIGRVLAAEPDELAGRMEISGTFTLTSSPPNNVSLVREGEAHTAFTGRLLHLLREGSEQSGELITLGEIYRHLLARSSAEELPIPQARGTATADQLGLVRNARPAPVVPATVPVEIRGLLESGLPRARRAGVEELGDWLGDPDPRRALAARLVLEDVAARDLPQVADAARQLLTRHAVEGTARSAASAGDPVGPVVPVEEPDRKGESRRQRALGLLAEAERLSEEIVEAHERAEAFGEIAGVVAAFDSRRASRLADQAESLAFGLTDPITSTYTLALIARAVFAFNPVRAARLTDRAERAAAGITEPGDPQLLEYLAEAGAALVDADPDRASMMISRAERLAGRITRREDQVVAISGIAAEVATIDPTRAVRLAEQANLIVGLVRHGLARNIVLAEIAAGLAAAGHQRAEIVADGIEHPVARALALALIAKTLTVTDRGRAVLLADEAERLLASTAAATAEYEQWRAVALAAIAEVLAAAEPQRAVDLAAGIDNVAWKTHTLTAIAQVWLTAEQPESTPATA
jgi:hypothetical protein